MIAFSVAVCLCVERVCRFWSLFTGRVVILGGSGRLHRSILLCFVFVQFLVLCCFWAY